MVKRAPASPDDTTGVLPDDADALARQAIDVLKKLRAKNLAVATAESCTGGLLASLLTDQEGYGHCFDRGFVTYTERAKNDLLGVSAVEIARHDAVSAAVARAMAKGALARSDADLALAITGFAGPAGQNDEVGLVHLACATSDEPVVHRECHFGDLSRERIRYLAVERSLEMIDDATGQMPMKRNAQVGTSVPT
jgi:nicotinamide-nucleotide amidase